MMKNLYIGIVLLFSSLSLQSQNAVDSINVSTEDNILIENTEQNIQLFPNNYLISQRLVWGEKGLIRNINGFELSQEQREKELDIRNYMISAHQYFGYATLAGMLAQGFVGAGLYNGDRNLKDVHEKLAGIVNFTYFTTAGLALFAPPRMTDRKKGFSKAKLHKYLSIIHLASMIATNALAGETESNQTAREWHRAAAYTAFGSLFVSMVVIKL